MCVYTLVLNRNHDYGKGHVGELSVLKKESFFELQVFKKVHCPMPVFIASRSVRIAWLSVNVVAYLSSDPGFDSRLL